MRLDSALLPESINVDGVFYPVRTDFKYWLRFHSLVKNGERHLLTDFDFLYGDEKPEDRQAGFDRLKEFFSPVNVLPRPAGTESTTKLYDFIIDSDLIYAAFFEQYGIDLLETNLHWHKFLALFNALHDTKFNEIVSYRTFKKDSRTKYEDQMEKLRRMWEITPGAEIDSEMTEDEKKYFESF
jgi:hypothetical protein